MARNVVNAGAEKSWSGAGAVAEMEPKTKHWAENEHTIEEQNQCNKIKSLLR